MRNVRIHDETYEKLKGEAKKERRSILSTIDIIVEKYFGGKNEKEEETM